jgi:ubiquinone/menaquinone biosynthesis C-methylase UbiE
MPPEYSEIYRDYAPDYEKLVSCEDWKGNLLPAIELICPIAGKQIVELGAGTGRLTMLLAPKAKHITAFDRAPAMLAVAGNKLATSGLKNWTLGEADNSSLPVPDGSADISIEGWALGHSAFWHEQNWKAVLSKQTGELLRVLRPGGTAIIIETRGTGCGKPAKLPPQLEKFYSFLSDELNFQSKWIRTDYKFPSLAQGRKLSGFFFNNHEITAAITDDAVLPECTGLWWKKI